MKTIRKHDEQGNLIFHQYYWGRRKMTCKWEYDERGNVIYEEDTRNGWKIYEYDSKNNIIYWKTKYNSMQLNIIQRITRTIINLKQLIS